MKVLVLIGLILSFSLEALEHPLITITSEEDNETTFFVLKTDDQNEEIIGFFQDIYSRKGEKLERRAYSHTEFQNQAGLVLNEQDGRIIIRMTSDNFAQHNGGHLTIDILYNGVTGSRRQYEYELARAGNTWELLRDNHPLRSMHLRSKKIFGLGTVGISDIIHQY